MLDSHALDLLICKSPFLYSFRIETNDHFRHNSITLNYLFIRHSPACIPTELKSFGKSAQRAAIVNDSSERSLFMLERNCQSQWAESDSTIPGKWSTYVHPRWVSKDGNFVRLKSSGKTFWLSDQVFESKPLLSLRSPLSSRDKCLSHFSM